VNVVIPLSGGKRFSENIVDCVVAVGAYVRRELEAKQNHLSDDNQLEPKGWGGKQRNDVKAIGCSFGGGIAFLLRMFGLFTHED
jgi:hypothetical protein